MSPFTDYVKSSLITFAVAFAIVIVAQIDTVSTISMSDGALFALIFAAVRAGVKAVLELLILTFKK